MRIICAANMKGGAGKSATTCWLANALAKQGQQRVLVIDADNQKTISDLRERNEIQLGEGTDKIKWDLVTANPKEAENLIEKVFEADKYDIIFIDMPRMTGLEDDKVINLLALCDSFLIPIKPSLADAMATSHFMATMVELKEIREEEGLPVFLYAFHNFYRNIRENEFLPEFASEIGVKLFDSKIKLKKVFEFYDTYTSLLDTQEGRDEFLPFLKEFILKYELNIPSLNE